MGPMKIATFNINGVNRRLANLLAWLAESRPDIACLQELKASGEAFPIEAIRGAGYGAVWNGQKTWNGVAILARGREPVVTRDRLPGDPTDAQSRYIEAAMAACSSPRSIFRTAILSPARNSTISWLGSSA